MFEVYSSVWFSAIYLLLMVSLIGCFIPRLRVYLTAVRARPPKAPRNLSRLGGVRHLDHRRRAGRGRRRAMRAALLARAASPRRRRTTATATVRRQGGEGLPARGGQPALPPRAAGRAGRGRVDRSLRLQGQRRWSSAATASPTRLTQYDEFTPGARFDRRRTWRRSASPSTTSTSSGSGRVPGPGTPLTFDADLTVTDEPRRRSPTLRPAGQPPARGGRHLGVPGRPRLRAVGDGDGRQRQRGVLGAGDVPAAGQLVRLLRRDQGARRRARAARFRGLLLPDRLAVRRGAVLDVPRRGQPGAVARRLPRRPRRSTTGAAVGLRARQGRADAGHDSGREARVRCCCSQARRSTSARARARSPSTATSVACKLQISQSARQGRSAGRRAGGDRRPARVAVHPSAPYLGARAGGRRAYGGRGRRARPGLRR